MKYITLIIATLAISCSHSKHSTSKHHVLDGTWIPVKQEIAGTALPSAAMQNQKLVLKDSTYTFTAESVDKGVAHYNNNKMDIYGTDGVNKGRHFMAIYKLENGELSICYNLAGDVYPENFDTKGHPKYFLCVFKKE